MKKLFYTLLTICLASAGAIAQLTVTLEINHKQGSKSFALNQTSTTKGGESYNAYRLEYYFAEVSLEHDGGMKTDLDSFWVLVDALNPATIDLGQHNITTLEAIHFSVGVEVDFNHLDPSQWISGHPLAPKSPSMHWGWAAGYRFFAMEGKCGSSVNYTYEFHSLGDNNYFNQRIETAGFEDLGVLSISLNADYDRVFDNITLGTGLTEHGEFPNNVLFLQNVRDFVFTSPEGNGNSLSPILGISDVYGNSSVDVYPNPSSGLVNISSSLLDLTDSDVILYDNMGRVMHQEEIQSWNGLMSIEVEERGHYILSVSKNNIPVIRKSIIVSK